MSDPRYLEPRKGLTSVEAAALYISDGMTRDPAKAVLISENKQNELDMDALQRAHLRRMMGFDFRMKMQPNKIHVSTTSDPYVSTYCKLKPGDVEDNMITNEATVDRLVDACARLKAKYDAAVAKNSRKQ